MAISRMQEPRQLYGLGSLVKKITRPIKKIIKSPIGKIGLGALAIGSMGGFGGLGAKFGSAGGRPRKESDSPTARYHSDALTHRRPLGGLVGRRGGAR